ncbi:MAG: GNAT family N-acetyltransferase [Clostridia bacterium]|nr:GNAT family N-acetyltransferase [Clostridia bacterium]
MAAITLRAMTEKDQEAMVAILRSDRVAETFILPAFSDDEQAARLFRRLMALSRDGKIYVRGAYDGELLVGFINQVDRAATGIEIGYAVSPDKWGRGYATAMLRAAIAELFAMGYAAVRCGYFEGNVASRRVMEKCGMLPVDEIEEIEYRGEIRKCLYRIIINGSSHQPE